MTKRLFDIVASGVALLGLAPVFLVVALLIRLDSRGPAFYRQARVGRGGRPFRIVKFRTMIDGADRRGPAVSLAGDTRVTRVGWYLRRFELDELPTFLNVLWGDMSLVGPRPETPKYLPYYTEAQKRVFSVRPGITDLGTLHFRNEGYALSSASDSERFYVEKILPEKLKLNMEYIDRQSFWYDVRIILRTLALVVRQRKG